MSSAQYFCAMRHLVLFAILTDTSIGDLFLGQDGRGELVPAAAGDEHP